jgi:hypothetical protein
MLAVAEADVSKMKLFFFCMSCKTWFVSISVQVRVLDGEENILCSAVIRKA